MFKRKLNEIRLAFFARIILIIGGLNYLLMGLNVKDKFLFITVPKNILNILFITIGVSALYLFFNRDYYLPFLGETVFPIVKPFENSKNTITTIIKNVPPNASVIYWAAKKETEKGYDIDPYIAYGDYSNSGISVANENGEAIIKYECPIQYKVGKFTKKILKKHIHYRYTDPRFPGLISPVKTLFLNEQCV